jgi:hypothetical protein
MQHHAIAFNLKLVNLGLVLDPQPKPNQKFSGSQPNQTKFKPNFWINLRSTAQELFKFEMCSFHLINCDCAKIWFGLRDLYRLIIPMYLTKKVHFNFKVLQLGFQPKFWFALILVG